MMADLDHDGSFLDEHAEDALLAGPDDDPSTGLGLQSPGVDETGVEDAELEAIKARVQEMEEEAEKLKELQNEVEKQMNMSSPPPSGPLSPEDKQEADNRSVYVGNVDYSTTAEELESHFHGCGSINRVTILCDKFTGHPKGFAYVEFSDKDMVQTALLLNDSLFKGRQIKVNAKRTNRPGISTTDRPGRSRFRGAGRQAFRISYSPYGNAYSGYTRPRRFRPRRYTRYSPY